MNAESKPGADMNLDQFSGLIGDNDFLAAIERLEESDEELREALENPRGYMEARGIQMPGDIMVTSVYPEGTRSWTITWERCYENPSHLSDGPKIKWCSKIEVTLRSRPKA